jgi:hypothetical protein|tara:strand:+ start:794 stop:1051 length:258 start_codon:yes stop_codon:yes gene_type:complete
MSNLTTKVKLTTGSRCRSCESNKAYAIKWRNEIFFVPISKSTMIELPNSDSSYKWELEIENWIINKNENLKLIVQLLKDEENEKL